MSPLIGALMIRNLLAKSFLALAATTLLAATSPAQDRYKPSPENLKARQDFQDDKFGLFIHWGVYSVLGDGEWVLHDRKLQLHDYERLPNFFNPEKFDAKAWVALAKAAGMKYITITSRHHDGFAMFDTKLSDWNIVQRTSYKKDPLKMLAEEAHRQ
ncbi:MAG TPA: alpha-L-fucosidase, partial [Candidatus Acidoferrum sp.]|nr:alpha-L-fucosidase [Candidatus Acidoferrum sp.]